MNFFKAFPLRFGKLDRCMVLVNPTRSVINRNIVIFLLNYTIQKLKLISYRLLLSIFILLINWNNKLL
jgi:hypothetical protein